MSNEASIFFVPVALLVFILWRLAQIGQRPKGYPPGPPTLPLLGNIHQIPSSRNHVQFEKWAQEYGPVYSLMLGTRVFVVLSSDLAVKDLLDKRSAIYSSRPDLYLIQHVASRNLRPLFMGYNEVWKMVRKTAHGVLNVQAARGYVPYQDLESKVMLQGLVDTPADFVNHIRRFTTSLTTQMTFGFRTPTSSDPELLALFENFDTQSQLATDPIASLLDFFPFLRCLPDFFLPIRKTAKKLYLSEKALFNKHFQNARKQLASDTAKPCCCIDVLKMQKVEGFSDDLASYMLGSLLQAGSETTSAMLISFVLAMVLNPDVAERAQNELDRVCGDRLPNLDDFPDLHYIRGCMKETLRWMPATALGVPHAVDKDDSYLGYHIPKGATILLNVWAIHNDPQRHPNPRRYDPSRWDGDMQNSAQSALSADPSKRDHFVFGAGRRMCQGMHIADRSLFLAMSRILWAFNINRAKDLRTGQELIPNPENTLDGLFMCPKPFEADISPRSEERLSLLKAEIDEEMTLLDDDLQWKTVPKGLKWKDYEPTSDYDE